MKKKTIIKCQKTTKNISKINDQKLEKKRAPLNASTRQVHPALYVPSHQANQLYLYSKSPISNKTQIRQQFWNPKI